MESNEGVIVVPDVSTLKGWEKLRAIALPYTVGEPPNQHVILAMTDDEFKRWIVYDHSIPTGKIVGKWRRSHHPIAGNLDLPNMHTYQECNCTPLEQDTLHIYTFPVIVFPPGVLVRAGNTLHFTGRGQDYPWMHQLDQPIDVLLQMQQGCWWAQKQQAAWPVVVEWITVTAKLWKLKLSRFWHFWSKGVPL